MVSTPSAKQELCGPPPNVLVKLTWGAWSMKVLGRKFHLRSPIQCENGVHAIRQTRTRTLAPIFVQVLFAQDVHIVEGAMITTI
jgi:hypothetical protein